MLFSAGFAEMTPKIWHGRTSQTSHSYLPILCLVFGEVENLFGHLVPFCMRIFPSLQAKHHGRDELLTRYNDNTTNIIANIKYYRSFQYNKSFFRHSHFWHAKSLLNSSFTIL